MNLHKSKIEWCTHTWNPVTGCRNGCSYCYARRFIDRFAPHPCEWPDEQLSEAEGAGVPVFMKDNLKGVWGDQLLRECPEGIDLADKKAVAEWDGE